MIQFDEFGPEKIFEVYDHKSCMHGFVVLDSTVRGVGKGGIRMTPSVTIEEVAKLARAMTWKNSIAELPFGGAKAGIIADDRKISKKEKMNIIEAFSRAIKSICPSLYVAGPDMNTGEEEMDAFAKANGSLKACTGKSKKMKGIPHELGSTGFGVYHATLVGAEHIGLDINGASVAIEGFGNVGSFVAKFLSEKGAKISAVSDSKGTIYNKDGLDYNKLMKTKEKMGSVTNYNPGKVLKGNDLFELPVDILIPAAIPDSINEGNYRKIKAKLISEGANIPMTAEIEKKLHEMDILVIPDFIANAGGVISSYVEYIGKNEDYMFKLVEEKIKKNTKLVLDRAKKENVCPREAGLEIAKERIKKR